MKISNIESTAPVKILFLEDEEQDVELMKQELDQVDFRNTWKRVSSKKEFLDALEKFKPDVILADYSLPMFNGMHAFRLFKEQGIFIPFILVTGALSEEMALECLSEGVDDFILKSSYKRLPSVIIRSIEIKNSERESEEVSGELKKRNGELRMLHENAEKAKARELLSNPPRVLARTRQKSGGESARLRPGWELNLMKRRMPGRVHVFQSRIAKSHVG